MIKFNGFWKMSFKYFKIGMSEFYRSMIIESQIKKIQKMVPFITSDMIEKHSYFAGIRAQGLDSHGTLIHDFVFEFENQNDNENDNDNENENVNTHFLHVRNAPSPACTASLVIAELIADKATQQFHVLKQ